MGSTINTAQKQHMRCLIALCIASMVCLSTANYYGGHQQMPVRYYVPSAMSGHQHLYVPQPQVVNLDLDYRPSVAFPGMISHNDGTTNSDFGSRSGSVTNVDTCQASKELAKDAVQANLNVLETISKANIDTTTMQNIFGQDGFQSRRGGSCSFGQIFSCGSSVTKAVGNCINTIGDGLGVDSVIGCVEEILGSGSDCLGCVCRFLGIVTKNRLRC